MQSSPPIAQKIASHLLSAKAWLSSIARSIGAVVVFRHDGLIVGFKLKIDFMRSMPWLNTCGKIAGVLEHGDTTVTLVMAAGSFFLPFRVILDVALLEIL